ncbi:glycine rich domain-containing protein [Segatella albensis]|uniref:glycine rich domain-containing protein n=1 Tax=Segatella albensis TaxID=77768 RepID=UPI0004698E4A|nr:glycine rich domain-containing protein [Segatella albensis]
MQTFTVPISTSYKIECWGASGGQPAGLGAYTNGYLNLSDFYTLYLYIGEEGKNGIFSHDESFKSPNSGTFNGGGGFVLPNDDNNNSQGGGATDIRLQSGDWNDFNSLKSRIMVAAGGGVHFSGEQSYGGALFSPNYDNTFPNSNYTTAGIGASQISGYKFGIGQSGGRVGAGGGYYGGNAFVEDSNYKVGVRGTGGSSFISGYPGCDAIDESSTEDNIVHTGQPNHYSGKVFTNPVMIAGNASMPKPKGGTETGHYDNGYAIISWISPTL